jgi:hypothetical protein
MPTAFPFLTIFSLFCIYTLINAMQIESYLDEVNKKSDHYAWIN